MKKKFCPFNKRHKIGKDDCCVDCWYQGFGVVHAHEIEYFTSTCGNDVEYEPDKKRINYEINKNNLYWI